MSPTSNEQNRPSNVPEPPPGVTGSPPLSSFLRIRQAFPRLGQVLHDLGQSLYEGGRLQGETGESEELAVSELDLRNTVEQLTDEKLRLQAEVDRLRELKPVDELLKAQDGWKSADRSRIEAQAYALRMRKENLQITSERDRLRATLDQVRELADVCKHVWLSDGPSPGRCVKCGVNDDE